MDGIWTIEVTPKVVKGDQYKPGVIYKTYVLSYQAVGTPWEKRAQYYFDSDRELEYHIKLLQSALDTKTA